jgi:hypothetical protein
MVRMKTRRGEECGGQGGIKTVGTPHSSCNREGRWSEFRDAAHLPSDYCSSHSCWSHWHSSERMTEREIKRERKEKEREICHYSFYHPIHYIRQPWPRKVW